MRLLGLYNSKLQAFHYQELLDLYKRAIANGDFAGNKTFDEAAINTLIKQAENFATLPVASEGQRVTDDSLNTPLDRLSARFNSLVSEANDFDTRAAGLISVLERDTTLLDQVLAGAGLNDWLADQPPLAGAQKFSWDFGMGNGPASDAITKADPVNGVVYPSNCPTNTYLDVIDSDQFDGLVAPESVVTIDAKNLKWSWTPMSPGEQSEDIYGDGWAELTLLEDNPIINFLPNPSVQTILPAGGSISGVFNVSGTVAGGALPIYIRTVFSPRRNSISIAPQNALPNPGFESGATGWTMDSDWTVLTGAAAHTGSKYVSKTFLPLWSGATTYSNGDKVRFNNQEWVSLSNGNLNHSPNIPGSTFWQVYGRMLSPSFPLQPSSRIYLETWIKSLSANGILNIALSCRDHADNEIGKEIFVPGITSAADWLKVSEVLTALADPNVSAGRLIMSVTGQTAGTWLMDDFRIHLPQNLSSYNVNQDEVSVYTPKAGTQQPLIVFFQNEQFVVDDVSNVTFMDLTDGQPYTIRFTESFPGYQCSVNEKAFSPLIMLDPLRPYPDNTKVFDPILIGLDSDGNRTLFPITDETGVPTGLTLQIKSRPLFEYYFQVTTPAQPQYGATAVLEIDLSKPSFMNGLRLTPFSTYPIRLVKVETESFTTDTRQTVGAPGTLLDRPMVLTFPTTLLRKIYLTCYQENYNLSEHVAQPPDALRRDTLFAIQTVLPFNVRRPSRAVPVYFRGAQYGFGLEHIAGIAAAPVLPGIFISGPQHFKGCPEVFRFDCSLFEATSVPISNMYLCWKAFNSSGVVIHQDLVGHQIVPGQCSIWPFPSLSLLNRAQVDHVEVFIKFVIRDFNTVIQRYLLQVRST